MKRITTPISNEIISELNVGDKVLISGHIITGRDAVLPRIVKMIEDGTISASNIRLEGGVIFHTAVSRAGVGPTSSNKLEIESSFPLLSEGGVKLHLGKGKISDVTVKALQLNNSVYAVIPPVTALLEDRTIKRELLAFPELGMEACYLLTVEDYPAIIAAAHGQSIY